MKKILILLILSFQVSLAQEGASDRQQLFKIHCQTCHGALGKGDGPAAQALEPPPRDLTRRPYKQVPGYVAAGFRLLFLRLFNLVRFA